MLESLRVENSGDPIHVQIRDQILQAIGAGSMRPGDQMPTTRQVAVALKIDLNTVKQAYDELEKIGAIKVVPGRGGVVAERLPDAQPQLSGIDDFARRTIAAARVSGIDPTELVSRIAAIMRGEDHEST